MKPLGTQITSIDLAPVGYPYMGVSGDTVNTFLF